VLSVACSHAASTLGEVDAAKFDCAGFREIGLDKQKRILAFLQGYLHRKLAEDDVGSVGIGTGFDRALEACAREPYTPVAAKVEELALGDDAGARGEARLTRPPTRITCRDYASLNREDQRLTVYWLDGYSRKTDANDANQSVVALDRDPEEMAKNACGRRVQRLWWAIQGGVRSVDPVSP
jgi:hypothetical protein